MKKILKILLVAVLIAGNIAQIHFNLAERAYVRQLAKTIDTNIPYEQFSFEVAKNVPSFFATEFPQQWEDYKSKVTAAQK